MEDKSAVEPDVTNALLRSDPVQHEKKDDTIENVESGNLPVKVVDTASSLRATRRTKKSQRNTSESLPQQAKIISSASSKRTSKNHH